MGVGHGTSKGGARLMNSTKTQHRFAYPKLALREPSSDSWRRLVVLESNILLAAGMLSGESTASHVSESFGKVKISHESTGRYGW